MRLGPGKHLKGLTLMGGIVKPEEFDYFHEVGSSPRITHDLMLIPRSGSLSSLKSFAAQVSEVMEMVRLEP